MNVAAVDLAPPAIANLDFPVAGGGTVADDEVVGEAVAHPANIVVIVVEDAGVALSGATVVYDDKPPAVAQHRSTIDLAADRIGEVSVAFPEKMKRKGKAPRLLVAGFFDDDLGGLGGA